MAKIQLEENRGVIEDSGHNRVTFNVTSMIISIAGFTFYNIIYLLQFGCDPVAVVILRVNKT